MQNALVLILGVLCVLSLGTPSADAKGKGKGKPNTKQQGKPDKKKDLDKGRSEDKADKGKKKDHDKKDSDWKTDGRFKDKDRSDLTGYWGRYEKHPHGLPPGLAKNLRRGKPLPPGWEKKLRNGWIIDRDSWDLFDRVPGDYLPKDFRLPKDTGVFLYGDRMVRVHEPTREVIDFVRIPTIKP